MKLSFKKSTAMIIVAAIILLAGIQMYYIDRIARNSVESLEAYTNTVMRQIENSLDAAFKGIAYTTTYLSINSAVQQYLSDEQQSGRYYLQPFVSDAFRSAIATNDQIRTALLFDSNGQCVYNYGSVEINFRKEMGEIERKCYEAAENNHFVFYQGDAGQKLLLCLTPVYENRQALSVSEQRIGTVMLVVRPDAIVRTLEETEDLKKTTFYLLDPEGNMMACSAEEDIPDRENENYTYLENEIWGGQGFRIVSSINNRWVVEEYRMFRMQMLLSCAVMIFLLLAIGYLFNRNIVHPIDSLIAEVSKLGLDRRKKRITGKYHLQLEPLVKKLNEMLDNTEEMSQRIFETQQRLYEAELIKNESELYALRSQINPHFLFNTLQCMGGIALMDGQKVVAQIASNMAEIFRYCIKEEGKVRVEEEIIFLKKYLYICDVRFHNRFQWEIQMQEEILQERIDKMILQPIVENAVYHGLEKRTDSGGMLSVEGREEGGILLFTVTDNAGQLTAEKQESLTMILNDAKYLEQEKRKRKQIGVVNIQSRLKLLYGEQAGVTIRSEGENTIVEIRIPKESNYAFLTNN